jgi:sortase B
MVGALAMVVYLLISLNLKQEVSESQPIETKPEPTVVAQAEISKEDASSLEKIKMLEQLVPYYNINADTVGHIKIGETIIDYPVVYNGDNEYYIEHNFEKDESKEGAIFLDYRCDYNDFSKTKNNILYGHRMKDGSMFRSLFDYHDKDFFYENNIIRFDTLYHEYEWQVFSVFETHIDFYYIDTDFPTDEKWMAFLEKCHGLSIYDADVKFYPTDVILTLSTCTVKKDKRLVVMAKLITK